MDTENISIRDIFVKNLRATRRFEHDEIANLYITLFSAKPKEELEEDFLYLYKLQRGEDDYFKKAGKEDWWYIWHKSIRQCDYFTGCYIEVTMPLLTNDENEELKFLRHEYRVKKKQKHSRAEGKLYTDKYLRYIELAGKKRRETVKESIGGILDSILWNMIHIDKDGVLHDAFKDTFASYERKTSK